MAQGRRIVVPEVVDYEVRRELLRAGKTNGIVRLNTIQAALEYVPITTSAMLLAADLWAQARQQGQPTADIHALDGDVILCAQALTLGVPANEIVVATLNVGHLARFLTAETLAGDCLSGQQSIAHKLIPHSYPAHPVSGFLCFPGVESAPTSSLLNYPPFCFPAHPYPGTATSECIPARGREPASPSRTRGAFQSRCGSLHAVGVPTPLCRKSQAGAQRILGEFEFPAP